MIRQFTATVYILNDEKSQVLLVHHKKLGKWLPPGGHIDPNETPPEAAVREAKEETGLDVELIKQENIWIERPNAKSLVRPYLCLLEEIPAHGAHPAHQHIDQIFVGRAAGGDSHPNGDEVHEMRWFSLEDLKCLNPEVDIFEETLETIHILLKDLSRQV